LNKKPVGLEQTAIGGKVGGNIVHLYRSPRVMWGFTELGVTLAELSGLFSGGKTAVRQLKQVHSGIVRLSSEVDANGEVEGDGIILDQKDIAAVIRTADCTPLFCWHEEGMVGGVIHIGWRGLLKGIEKEALARVRALKGMQGVNRLRFFMGPAIEQTCYEVGRDVYDLFAGKPFREEIFLCRDKGTGKYLLDVKKGIRLSLRGEGIEAARIDDSGICTFCEPERFPSYRRQAGTGKRIYNFLLLTKP
jgi:YfiH family protein